MFTSADGGLAQPDAAAQSPSNEHGLWSTWVNSTDPEALLGAFRCDELPEDVRVAVAVKLLMEHDIAGGFLGEGDTSWIASASCIRTIVDAVLCGFGYVGGEAFLASAVNGRNRNRSKVASVAVAEGMLEGPTASQTLQCLALDIVNSQILTQDLQDSLLATLKCSQHAFVKSAAEKIG